MSCQLGSNQLPDYYRSGGGYGYGEVYGYGDGFGTLHDGWRQNCWGPYNCGVGCSYTPYNYRSFIQPGYLFVPSCNNDAYPYTYGSAYAPIPTSPAYNPERRLRYGREYGPAVGSTFGPSVGSTFGPNASNTNIWPTY